jgi:hypothetical protein|tara:strand:- start:310 stop:540 length:231 start_codon:yes stop_codon:yes gene_type:complete
MYRTKTLYPVGSLVEEHIKNSSDIRYGIIVSSEATNGKEFFIDVHWFSDPLADAVGIEVPYLATVRAKRVHILSHI